MQAGICLTFGKITATYLSLSFIGVLETSFIGMATNFGEILDQIVQTSFGSLTRGIRKKREKKTTSRSRNSSGAVYYRELVPY